jgi:FtsZ-interacting cell division protein ZipA
MDSQTFAGLNLFIVLPGSQPPLAALEALVVSARALAQRLGGELRTAANEALGDAEVQQLRQSLREPDAAVLRTAGAA